MEFFVFPDGSFDFDTNFRNSLREQRHLRRSNFGTKYRTGNRALRYTPQGRRSYIKYDAIGQIRRIDNIYIDYDRRGKVRRIGSVDMQYHRGKGRLKQVGGLKVNYNHWGEIVHTRGAVNPFNRDMNCGLYDDYAWNDYYDYDDRWNDHRGKRKRGK